MGEHQVIKLISCHGFYGVTADFVQKVWKDFLFHNLFQGQTQQKSY